jgi:PAS domain S-box-containing protein
MLASVSSQPQGSGDRAGNASMPNGRLAAANRVRPQLRSYAIVVGLFLLLLVVALATSWSAIQLVNDTRAYATGEGRYSKAQKLAILDLYRYADSQNTRDYDAFLKDIDVPTGDRAARVALTQSPPDTKAAAQGFLRGQNHPSDIDGLIQLFRWFSWWKPFVEAIQDWRLADGEIGDVIAEGRQLHDRILAGTLDADARAQTFHRIATLDDRLTRRENTFSTHMGEAARAATTLVVVGLGISTVLLWTIGILFATRLFRQQLALDRQLVVSESRFRDFAEVASDWYWEMDADNRITYLSERLYHIVNAAPDDVLGADATDLIRQSADDPAQRDDCLHAIKRRQPFRGVCLRFASVEGDEGYGAISGKPMFSAAGDYLGYRGVGSDITAQMHDARMLREAKDRAEVANRAKSEFLANMSHELRTPLNAILGFSDIIRSRIFGSEAIDRYTDYADDIHRSGAHLLGIINDILDLSKIEAGQAELDESYRTLDVIFHEARVLLGDRPSKQGVSFHVAMPEPVPMLRVDERKVTQILVNLLSNAFKFTPPGGNVSLSAELQRDGGLTIVVQDNGIGIAPDHLETVLSPFGQVESAFSRNHHGTGLGLPLAKSMAELHGGTLSLESTAGRGTTVTVTLPRARVTASSTTQRARA